MMPPDGTLPGKWSEIGASWRLRQIASRKLIGEVFLNGVYLGRNRYGIDAAAQEYFGVRPEELQLVEAAQLSAGSAGGAVHFIEPWVGVQMFPDSSFVTPWSYYNTIEVGGLVARLEGRMDADYIDGELLVKAETFECEQRLRWAGWRAAEFTVREFDQFRLQ